MSGSVISFPITLSATWQPSPPDDLADNLTTWLLDPGSLTARLKACCGRFRVELLGQTLELCQAYEASENIAEGTEVLVREVLLYCDDKPQVFARSLLPLSSLTGPQAQLAQLGEQSLGQVIFNSPSLKRQGLEVASFSSVSSVAQLASELKLPQRDKLWGRRSFFFVEDKPLMVAEVFLPQAFAYQGN